ncbi:MAG: RecQ family ATP-dependent DNA helicase [Syntrophomonadaceae bacterium]|nr:RecQ family ATP-dependent DNA helicase [Syntrophomonadaceae bacterium]
MAANMDEILQKYYPGSTWRAGQREIVEAIMAGRDVLAVMPTGYGKSLCYQLPAAVLPGLTLVISPLIALMKDQVEALRRMGLPAAYLNRSLDSQGYRDVLRRTGQGAYRLLYIAPERLRSPRFLRLMQETPVSLVAVDEAHCVSLWGHDFRPDYMRIRGFAESLPSRPVMAALTATAGERTRADIIEQLGLRSPCKLFLSFDRPNLYLAVVYPRDKKKFLRRYLQQHREQSGIIYCATRNSVDELCRELRAEGLPAQGYHAALTGEERRRSQEGFLSGHNKLMVATNAFGMGIDKADVGFVIHYHMPLSLESYYQEVGRAGRNGEPADCLLLYAERDRELGRLLIDHSMDDEDKKSRREISERRRHKYLQLERMNAYALERGCLRRHIMDYFGEVSPQRCGNCSVCLGHPEQGDLLRGLRKLFKLSSPRTGRGC